eukprot:scaffold9627_cov123-Isochrysis_galbana.AAC.4
MRVGPCRPPRIPSPGSRLRPVPITAPLPEPRQALAASRRRLSIGVWAAGARPTRAGTPRRSQRGHSRPRQCRRRPCERSSSQSRTPPEGGGGTKRASLSGTGRGQGRRLVPVQHGPSSHLPGDEPCGRLGVGTRLPLLWQQQVRAPLAGSDAQHPRPPASRVAPRLPQRRVTPLDGEVGDGPPLARRRGGVCVSLPLRQDARRLACQLSLVSEDALLVPKQTAVSRQQAQTRTQAQVHRKQQLLRPTLLPGGGIQGGGGDGSAPIHHPAPPPLPRPARRERLQRRTNCDRTQPSGPLSPRSLSLRYLKPEDPPRPQPPLPQPPPPPEEPPRRRPRLSSQTAPAPPPACWPVPNLHWQH